MLPAPEPPAPRRTVFNRVTEVAAVAMVFAVLGVMATWPLARHLGDVIPGDLGDPLLNAWILGWDADRLRHGLRGLWDAPNFFPYLRTLAFSEHLLGIAVWTAPLVWLRGGSPMAAYNVAILLSYPLAGVGAYLLGRELTGRRDAALVTAVAFTFCQARLPHISHLQLLWTGWTPLMLWALHGYFRSGSRVRLAAFAFFWLEQTGSNLYTIYLTAPVIAAVVVAGLWQHRAEWRRPLVELAVTAGVMLAVFAPVAHVYREVRSLYGLHRSEQDITHYGADIAAYTHGSLGIVPQLSLSTHLFTPYAKPEGPEGELFPGLGVVLLAGAGVTAWGRRRERLPSGLVYAVSGGLALLLSFGAAPSAWGTPLPLGGVYRLLYSYAPGFDGLRVPARFAMGLQLSLAVFAGFAISWLPLRSRVSTLLALVAALFVLAEGYPRSIPLLSIVEVERGDRATYRWIRAESPGPMLEMPMADFATEPVGFVYQYRSLWHGQRLVDGRSGYDSTLRSFFGGPASPLAELEHVGEGIRSLRDIGIRTVVFHPAWFRDPAIGTSMIEAFRAERGHQVLDETRFGDTSVFRLAPTSDLERAPLVPLLPAAAVRQVDASAWTVSANQDSERLGRLRDGDADTRWFSDGAQSGREVVDITFDRPRDIACLRFETSERSTGDYARNLQIESVGVDGTSRVLFRGNLMRWLVDGMARDPKHNPVELWLPPSQSTKLVLRQLGSSRTWQWSIDELSVWEPRLARAEERR